MLSKEKRKEYDKQRSRKMYELYKQERIDVLAMYGNQCCVCTRNDGQLHLHHKEYGKESNYPRTSSGWSRTKRVREAKAYPERFALLCCTCHGLCTIIQKAPQKILDICGLAKASR